MRTEVMTITPEIAGDWLAINTRNRRMKDAWVRELAARIERGEWALNGEPIIISEDNVLVDGQHRLAAVIVANKPIESAVTYVEGFPYETIDQGRPRYYQDKLYVDREQNYSRLAAILAWEYRLDHGVMHLTRVRPSHTELTETLERHPELREAAMRGHEIAGIFRFIPSGLATWLYHKFCEMDEPMAQEFYGACISGANLSPGSPILALRERLISNRSGTAKLNAIHLAALVIKAWNAYHAGHDLLVCVWRSGEAFPAIGDIPRSTSRARARRAGERTG